MASSPYDETLLATLWGLRLRGYYFLCSQSQEHHTAVGFAAGDGSTANQCQRVAVRLLVFLQVNQPTLCRREMVRDLVHPSGQLALAVLNRHKAVNDLLGKPRGH